jgi:hypothetical protein
MCSAVSVVCRRTIINAKFTTRINQGYQKQKYKTKDTTTKLINSYRGSIEDLEVFTLLLFLGAKSSFEVFRRLSLRIIRAAANAIVRTLFDPLMILTSHSPQK